MPLRPGDQILTGRAEYGSNVLAYWQAASRAGAEVVVVPNDEHGQLDVAALERLAGPRTRLIGVSHVPTSGGLVQPAAEIGRIARACGALFCWMPPSRPAVPVSVDAIGCDLLTGTAASCAARGYRLLVGARGRAGPARPVRGRDRLGDLGRAAGLYLGARRGPVRRPGSTATSTSWAWAPPSGRLWTWAWRRSGSGPPRWAPGSRQLAGLPGVTVHDLGPIRCAIVTANVDGLAAEEAAHALARAGVNVSTTVPEDNPLDTQDRGVHPLIRFSPHYYNTEDEIDRATELVAGLARLPAPHRTDLKPRPPAAPQRQNSPRQN